MIIHETTMGKAYLIRCGEGWPAKTLRFMFGGDNITVVAVIIPYEIDILLE